jgi:hypothetical protein
MKLEQLNKLMFITNEFEKHAKLEMNLQAFKTGFCDKVSNNPESPLQKGIAEAIKKTQETCVSLQNQLAEYLQDIGAKAVGN